MPLPLARSVAAATPEPAYDELADLLIRNSTDGVFVADLNLQVRVWNAVMEALTEQPAHQVLGERLTEVLSVAAESPLRQALRQVLQEEKPQQLDETELLLTGSWSRACALQLFPLRGAGKSQVTAILGLVRSSTGRQAAANATEPALLQEETDAQRKAQQRFPQQALVQTEPENWLLQDLARQLAQEQHFNRQLTSASPFVISVVDLESQTVSYSNRPLYLQLGYKADDLQALGPDLLAALLHPEDQARHLKRLQLVKSATEGEVLTFSVRLRHKKGHWVWFQVLVRDFRRDAQGHVTQVLCFLQETEEAKRNQELLRGVLESAVLGLTAFRAERDDRGQLTDFRCLLCSAQAATMLGRKPKQLTGRSLRADFPAPLGEDLFRRFTEALAQGQPQSFTYDCLLDGGQVFLHLTAAPLEDGLTVTLKDITERKLTEHALQENELFNRQILQSAPLGIAVLGLPQGNPRYLNPQLAGLLGFSVAEVMAWGVTGLREHIHPDDLPPLLAHLKELLQAADGAVMQFSFRARHRSGYWRRLASYHCIFRRSASGTPTETLSFLQDEEELHKSRALLTGVLNSSASAIMALRAERNAAEEVTDFVCVLLNEAAGRLVGLPVQTLTGKRLLQELPGQRTDGLFEQYAEVLQTGKPLQLEHYYRHDGLQAWLRIAAVRLSEDELILTLTDISDEKFVASRLSRNEHLLAEAQAAAGFGIWEWHASTDTLHLSDHLCGLLGQEPRHFSPDLAQLLALVQPADRPAFKKAMADGFLAQEAFEAEFGVCTPTGATRYLRWCGYPEPQSRRLLGFAFDVTEAVHQRAQLQRLAQLQELSSRLPQLTATVSPAGVPEYLSPHWQRFGEWAPVTGQRLDWKLLVSQAEAAGWEQQWRAFLGAPRAWAAEVRLRAQEGPYRWHLLQGVPRLSAAGKPERWFITATDIDEQKRLIEQQRQQQRSLEHYNQVLQDKNLQLRQASLDMDRFIRFAVHNLKEPVINLRELVYMLANTGTIPPDLQHSVLRMTELSVKQLLTTVADLRELSVLELSTLEEPDRIGLALLLENIRSDMQLQLQAQEVNLTYELTVPVVFFPRSQIRSILYTLISNAIQLRESGRLLEVKVESVPQPGHWVRIQVSHNGRSLDPYQLQAALSGLGPAEAEQQSGTRGLFVIRQIVESTGGRLEVSSATGQGTTVALLLKPTADLPTGA